MSFGLPFKLPLRGLLGRAFGPEATEEPIVRRPLTDENRVNLKTDYDALMEAFYDFQSRFNQSVGDLGCDGLMMAVHGGESKRREGHYNVFVALRRYNSWPLAACKGVVVKLDISMFSIHSASFSRSNFKNGVMAFGDGGVDCQVNETASGGRFRNDCVFLYGRLFQDCAMRACSDSGVSSDFVDAVFDDMGIKEEQAKASPQPTGPDEP